MWPTFQLALLEKWPTFRLAFAVGFELWKRPLTDSVRGLHILIHSL